MRSLAVIFPSVLSEGSGVFDGPKKLTVVRLRWLVIIVCAYLLLCSDTWLSNHWVHGLILCYLMTGVGCYLIDEKLFDYAPFYSGLVILDTLVITASLVISRQIESDFYLVYFLIIFLCAIWKDARCSVGVTAIIAVLYGSLLLIMDDGSDSSIFLRVPFIFVVSLFYSYFVELLSTERTLRQKAEIDAGTDALTHLFNRKAFEQKIEHEFHRSNRYFKNMAIMMIDLDDFKQINDTYGHQSGDRVLTTVAEVLSHATRQTDIHCRYGGEEFVIILPETTLEAAATVAHRIRAAISEMAFDSPNGSFTITASVGISSTSERTYGNWSQMVRDADRRLYIAKRDGKDRVETSALADQHTESDMIEQPIPESKTLH
ncbi:MAG TPA: GGDEF domain-containing protein [Candidatus Binatia bacterium]|nr:GGDEF domain-containing protein [Candidatus Binatia bacterium]